MKPLLVITLSIFVSVALSDVSHLASHVPNTYYMQHHQHHHRDRHKQQPDNERFETTIERHQVVELPTQIEIVKNGELIYGIDHLSSSKGNSKNPYNTRFNYLKPAQETENLQPPQVPYEMPLEKYLPPVAADSTTIAVMVPTTTTASVTGTNMPLMEERHVSTSERNISNYFVTTTEAPAQEYQSYDTTTSLPEFVTIPDKNTYLPLMSLTLRNQYLPPLGIMLPPLELMHPLPHQQYDHQLVR